MAVLDNVIINGTSYGIQDTKAQSMVAPTESTSTASAAHAVGSYFIFDGALYRATADIASGGTITPNTNCVAVTVGAETSELKSALDYLFNGNAIFATEWLQGGYSDITADPPTSANTSTARVHAKILVDVQSELTIKCADGFKFVYSIYVGNTRKTYSSSYITAKTANYTGINTVYITLAKNSGDDIMPSEAYSAISILSDNNVGNLADEIKRLDDSDTGIKSSVMQVASEGFPGNANVVWDWKQGSYANLSNDPPVTINDGTTRIYLHLTLAVKNQLVIDLTNGYKYLFSLYVNNVRKTYESGTWVTTTQKILSYGPGTYDLYMNLAKSDNGTIVPADAGSGIYIRADNAVKNFYDVIQTLNSPLNLFDPYAYNSMKGYYDTSGTWHNSAGDPGQTDFIPVEQGKNYTTNNKSTFVLWYNSSKEFIGYTSSSDHSSQGYVTPIANAAYGKFLIQASYLANYYVIEVPSKYVLPKDAIPYGVRNQYSGKKGVAFGTSLTYRANTSGGYLEYLPVMGQMTFDNQGVGNSTIMENASHTDMMAAITGYTGYSDKDVVLLEGFVNDWYDNAAYLGTWEDSEDSSVCGCVRIALNHILTQVPYATIIMILDNYGQSYNGDAGCASTVEKSGLTQFEFYEEIAKVAESLGVPVIKGYAISGMNEKTPNYFIDIIHPSAAGAKRFADVIWAEMQRFPLK